jgi:iron complex transport system ATP-binding protein
VRTSSDTQGTPAGERSDGRPPGGRAIAMRGVAVLRRLRPEAPRAPVLEGVDWDVEPGEHWVVLGPNGAGKSTLLELGAAVSHPSAGEVWVLGRRLGRTDLRALRERIGLVDARTGRALAPALTGEQVLLTGAFGSIGLQGGRLREADRQRAADLLRLVGAAELARRPFDVCSQGERQRLLLARALMAHPSLLALDEPARSLDLAARERLIGAMTALAARRPDLPTVTVTHHLEEIPPTTTHALLLRAGRVLAAGPLEDVLRDEPVSACFGVGLRVRCDAGRWRAALRDASVPHP